MNRAVNIGAIIEVPTKKGLSYVQFSHYHESPPPKMGAIIRLLPGVYAERPTEFQMLADQKELFYTLFPVQAAVSQKIFSVVGEAEVPRFAKKFPLFRSGVINPATGKVEQWWLWDGSKSWKVGRLTDDQLDLPIKSGWNDALLISRIDQGWTPRKAEAFVQAARQRGALQKSSQITGIRHFLLFRDKAAADRAKLELDKEKFCTEVLDSGRGFTLIVQQGLPLSEEYVEHVTVRLAEVARIFGGEYDAWETQLSAGAAT
jgi:hypothetical protein